MRLTYNEALRTIIEHTENGYTIASQDRLWIVFTFDLDSEGEHWSLRYNRLYPLWEEGMGRHAGGWSYDLLTHSPSEVPVFTTRAEAEFFAQELRGYLAGDSRYQSGGVEPPPVFVMNLGDDARFEAQIIGRYGVTVRDHPKFKGSEAAWKAMAEMGLRYSMWREQHEQEMRDDEEPSCP